MLRQNTAGQAKIVAAIVRFRAKDATEPSVPPLAVTAGGTDAYKRLVQLVEWKLIEMPLPRLQTMGQSQQPLIYEIHWDQRMRRQEVKRYPAGDASPFDGLTRRTQRSTYSIYTYRL